MDAFCSCPKKFPETDFKSNGVVSLLLIYKIKLKEKNENEKHQKIVRLQPRLGLKELKRLGGDLIFVENFYS